MANELAAITTALTNIRLQYALIAAAPAVRDSLRGGQILRDITEAILIELDPTVTRQSAPALEYQLALVRTGTAVRLVAQLKDHYPELAAF